MVTSTGVRASPSEHEFSPSRIRLCCLDLVLIALQYCIKVQNPGKWFTWNICTLYIGIHIEYWLLIIFLPSTTAAVTLIRRRKSLGSIANCYRFSLGSWRTAATGSPCDLGDLELWTATCPHWSHMVGGDKRSQVVRRQVLPFVIGDVLDNKSWLNFIARSFLSYFFTLLHWKSLSMGGLFTFYVDKATKKLFEVKAYCTITFNGRDFIIFRK